MSCRMMLSVPVLLMLVCSGCSSPASTAAKIGMHVVGMVVDDEETKKLGQQLLGQPPAAADAVLGQEIDALRDVNSPREWLIYPVKLDILNTQRYVVELAQGVIVAVEMVKKSTSEIDIPVKLYLEAKVKGKPIEQCPAALGLGQPMLTLRSMASGQLIQIYDATLVKELSSPHYCILRFDSNRMCAAVELAQVAASAK